jgi:hypothetical protein
MFIEVTPNSVPAVVLAISRPRLSNYVKFFGCTDDSSTLGLYQWNEDVSSRLFRLVSLIEVVLRNQLHGALSSHFGVAGASGSKDWYNHLALSSKSKDKIRAVAHTKKHGAWVPRIPTPKPDDVVSKLTFGFWVNLLGVQQSSAGTAVPWGPILLQVAPGYRYRSLAFWIKPTNQDLLFGRLDLVNAIRNRLAHHEPVWKFGQLMEEGRDRPNHQLQIIAPAPTSPAEAIARLQIIFRRCIELLLWLSPPMHREFTRSQGYLECLALLSESALETYRNRRPCADLDLGKFDRLRTLRKALKYSKRHRIPAVVNDAGRQLGHWTPNPL